VVEPDVVLVLPEEPEDPLVEVVVEPDEPEEPLVNAEPEPLELLLPVEPDVGAGAVVTGTSTVAPVVVFTRVNLLTVPSGEVVTGMSATVEPPRDVSRDGSVTTRMLPDKLGPVEGAIG